ncbi:MAG: ATP-binding protein [Clostridia bacterium]|nr:ATP-binding protein [Clostridia bacterium]MBR6479503.1 ATP-binding protein [Clostridia bacterium]MBR6512014.1 ATP-binding protein [Clostridia bacterium]
MAAMIERAMKVIESRKAAAERAAEERRRELETVSPELKELNRRISRTGLEALKAVTAGDNSAALIEKLSKESAENIEKRAAVLVSLGLPADTLDVHYTCPVCEDTGRKDGHYCECLKALVRQFQHDSLCSCTPAKECTFENFRLDYYDASVRDHMSQVLDYCKAWAADFDRTSNSILMYGQTGLGKTHLSLAVANVVLEKGNNVIYTSAGNLFSKLEKESFGRLSADEAPMDTAISCDLLILDDLGSEFTKPFVVSAFYNIVNSRLLAGLPTIISTNLMYDEIADRYDPRVYSRIIGNYQMLEFTGRDIRQIKSEE